MTYCSVNYCFRNRNTDMSSTFHHYPKNFEQCMQWIDFSQNAFVKEKYEETGHDGLRNQSICSQHFLDECYFNPLCKYRGLKPGSIPTIKENSENFKYRFRGKKDFQKFDIPHKKIRIEEVPVPVAIHNVVQYTESLEIMDIKKELLTDEEGHCPELWEITEIKEEPDVMNREVQPLLPAEQCVEETIDYRQKYFEEKNKHKATKLQQDKLRKELDEAKAELSMYKSRSEVLEMTLNQTKKIIEAKIKLIMSRKKSET